MSSKSVKSWTGATNAAGQAHGSGTAVFESTSVYVGDMKNGMRHGHGRNTNASGYVFVGLHYEGERHGEGTLTKGVAVVSKGTWRRGLFVQVVQSWSGPTNAAFEPHGHGRAVFESGATYEGQMANGLRHGYGKTVGEDPMLPAERATREADVFNTALRASASSKEDWVDHPFNTVVNGEVRLDHHLHRAMSQCFPGGSICTCGTP